jgi:3-methylcrotonyl-CoA carboxylase beta subunit
MVMAVACAKVPKFTVVIGGSFGAGNYGMCGRAYEPALPVHVAERAHLVMGGEQAAGVLTDVKKAAMAKRGVHWTPEQEAELPPALRRRICRGNPPLLRQRALVG